MWKLKDIVDPGFVARMYFYKRMVSGVLSSPYRVPRSEGLVSRMSQRGRVVLCMSVGTGMGSG